MTAHNISLMAGLDHALSVVNSHACHAKGVVQPAWIAAKHCGQAVSAAGGPCFAIALRDGKSA